MYYRGVNGVVLVCDLFSKDTFKALDGWLSEFLQKQDKTSDYTTFGYVLLANKSDMKEEIPEVSE